MSKLHTYHFPFLSSEIKFEFIENINSDIALGINEIVQVLKKDLSSKYVNSSAYKLNNASKNIPVIVSPEFIDYVDINLKYYSATVGDFNPFLDNLNKYNLNEIINIIPEESAIIKLSNFRFDSSLLKFYILKKIINFLDFNNITNYYFSYIDIVGSFGNITWNANFKIPDTKSSVHFKLNNSYGYLFVANKNKKVKNYSKFANLDKKIDSDFIILKGKNLIDLKILSYEIENMTWLHQYKGFAAENKINVIIYTDKKEVIEV